MTGACSCEKKNFQIAYQDELRLTAVACPDLSALEVKQLVARKLRPKFKADLASVTSERANFSEYEGPEFTVDELGRVYYPAYGRGMVELNERTRDLTPEQYIPAQHKASLLVEQAFREGATRVVTAFFRPGGDHRDLVEMIFDPVTRKGKTKVINTAPDGNYHSFEKMSEIAQGRFADLTPVKPIEHVFILADKPPVFQRDQEFAIKPDPNPLISQQSTPPFAEHISGSSQELLVRPEKVIAMPLQPNQKKTVDEIFAVTQSSLMAKPSEIFDRKSAIVTPPAREVLPVSAAGANKRHVHLVEWASLAPLKKERKTGDPPGRLIDRSPRSGKLFFGLNLEKPETQKAPKEIRRAEKAIKLTAKTEAFKAAVSALLRILSHELPKPIKTIIKKEARQSKKRAIPITGSRSALPGFDFVARHPRHDHKTENHKLQARQTIETRRQTIKEKLSVGKKSERPRKKMPGQESYKMSSKRKKGPEPASKTPEFRTKNPEQRTKNKEFQSLSRKGKRRYKTSPRLLGLKKFELRESRTSRKIRRRRFGRSASTKEILLRARQTKERKIGQGEIETRRPRRIERQLAFVFVLWLIVAAHKRRTHRVSTISRLKVERKKILKPVKRKATDTSILAAIIWYLEAFKEVHLTNLASLTSSINSFPPTGVIFAVIP